MSKKLLLDTNVIMDYPNCLSEFENSDIYIHFLVIQELDKAKKFQSKEGKNARKFIKIVESLNFTKTDPHAVYHTNKIYLVSKSYKEELVDDELLSCAKNLSATLVTNDLNLSLKCKCKNVNTIKYFKKETTVDFYKGHIQLKVSKDFLDILYHNKYTTIDSKLEINQYVHFISDETDSTAICKYDGRVLRLIPTKHSAYKISPKNAEQIMAFDALRCNNTHLVTICGEAGTGKTLITMSNMLMKLFKNKLVKYDKIYISKPICSSGGKKNDLGFLPGDVNEKLKPSFASFYDAIDFIKKINVDVDDNILIKTDEIEMLPITYLRGRSISNSLIILDEAQNCSIEELKTLITRAGENTKIVLLADINQIDDRRLSRYNNGFSGVVEAFKGQDIYAHIELTRCERSRLAELGTQLL